jgi:ATP-dependent Lon protease
VQKQLQLRTVRAGEEELFKARAKDEGRVKLIDIVRAKLDADNNCFVAELPSLRLNKVRISDELVHKHDRMLTGGFYAEIDVNYDPVIAEEGGHAFGIESLREIQLSKRDVLEAFAKGREAFSFTEWRDLLLRSIGLEPSAFSERTRDVMLLRMVPFVENNYNAVELGPRGTGKSHLFQQVSPYAHLVSGGKATVARMFVNNANGQRGLVCQYDVVCFDEVSGISFDQKDGVNIMKGYMESGEFSRGKESIRGFGSVVMVGNFDVDVSHHSASAIYSARCRPKCATTPRSWIASMPISLAGIFRRSAGSTHRALRPRQRFPLIVLESPSCPNASEQASRPHPVRRSTERTRYQRGAENHERPAQAHVPQP